MKSSKCANLPKLWRWERLHLPSSSPNKAMAFALSPPLLYLCALCHGRTHGSSANPSPFLGRPRRSHPRIRNWAAPPKSPPQGAPDSDSKPVPVSSDAQPRKRRTRGGGPLPWWLGLEAFWDYWKYDELGREIVSIALPAVLALAADPITSLVDSAFVGHLGSAELAGVGVSISVFNLVSKLFNVPLLNVTTSFVAEEQAFLQNDKINFLESENGTEGKKLVPAISTSLALAAGIGIAEALALFSGSGYLMNIMGIDIDSPMRVPAEEFLRLRAFGAPPLVIALAAQGTFRGFMDTKTPLYAVGAGNLLNAILDAIFIYICGLGVSGAAIATVISEYLIVFILLWKLNEKVFLVRPDMNWEGVARYLKAGGLLIGRTFAVLVTVTLATSMAARQGPISMAGYEISLQVWLAVSLLNDALALAGQALLASSYAKEDYARAQEVIDRIVQIGLLSGFAMASVLFIGFGSFSELFTSDSAVLEVALSGTLFVSVSQPLNALAFVFDGLYYGTSDFKYAAYSMITIGLFSSLFILMSAPFFGLAGIWSGLILFMSLRVIAGFWRINTKGGPWKTIWSDARYEVEDEE